MIRIVTDTTCDLPEGLLKQHHISVVPINIQLGPETHEEGISLTRKELYRKVEESNRVPMRRVRSQTEAIRTLAVHFGPGTVGVVGYNPQFPRGASR